MSKKVAVVTGGTRGIGAAIVRRLSADGFDVIATYAGNDERAKKIQTDTGCGIKKFDVSDYDSCSLSLKEIEDDHGRIDVLVNNAGITNDGVLHKMSYDQWSSVVRTNLDSCFNTCRSVLKGMREREYGRVINISSINGQKGQFGQANYAASKAGMIGFTKSIALENARKSVTANVICPGYIETDMTEQMEQNVLQNIISNIPVSNMGQPDDIANLVAFLASEQSSFITGAVLPINGGQFMGG
jgi:acetoacetyl-CoA reductase